MRGAVTAITLILILIATTAHGQTDFGSFSKPDLFGEPSEAPHLTTENPVTGRPQFDLSTEQEEIDRARQYWALVRDMNEAEGFAIDAPGEQLDRTRRVFERLVGVAHRQHLPWEVHVISSPTVNAATPGGGMVWVFGGLFGGMFQPETDENQLAAILSHEIAHVTLLHLRARTAQLGLGAALDSDSRSDYYRAAFSTEQEAEADRLGVLYMALAGFNPMSAHVVWKNAHAKSGSSAAAHGYMHDHPLNAQRVAITLDAATKVSQYRIPGERNPNWALYLANNALYVKMSTNEQPGSEMGGALSAGLDAFKRHRQAKKAAKDRRKAAQTIQNLELRKVFEANTNDGHRGIFVEVFNPGPRPLASVSFAVDYLQGSRVVGTDLACGGALAIQPGTVGQLGCYKKQVSGSTSWQVRLTDARVAH